MVHPKYKEGEQVRRRGDQAVGTIAEVSVIHGLVIYVINFPDGERHLTEASVIPLEVETRFTGEKR